MWFLCGLISVVLCLAGWVLNAKKSSKALWASISSLAFVSITLLMEYREIMDWANKEDWGALTDVVPSMFTILTGYVIIMLFANILPSISAKR